MKNKNKRYEKRQKWSKPRISKLGLHLTKGGWNSTTEKSNGVNPDFGGAGGSTT